MTTIKFLTAADWGMRTNGTLADHKMPVGEVYVHHTAGAHPRDPVAAFRALNEYAITRKGYVALDYSMLVHYDPTIDVVTIGDGRAEHRPAATLDRNEQSKAICLLGYFQSGHKLTRAPFPAELDGVARGIHAMIRRGWVKRDAVVRPHRDNPAHPNATSCCGDLFIPLLPIVRRKLDLLLNPPAPPPPPTTGDIVNWNPSPATVAAVVTAPPVTDTVANKANDWAMIAFLKAIQESNGLPVTGRYDQTTADVVNQLVGA